MGENTDRKRALSPKELEGFIQLLCATDGLPEPNEGVVAFIERLAAQNDTSEERARVLAKTTIAGITREKLSQSHVSHLRAFNSHLKAKRIEAKCSANQVAVALDIDPRHYERLESGDRNPLEEASTLLARIVFVFSLNIAEFRDAVIEYIQTGPTVTGARFARGVSAKLSGDQIALAAEDLRSKGRLKHTIPEQLLYQVDEKVAEVQVLLQKL